MYSAESRRDVSTRSTFVVPLVLQAVVVAALVGCNCDDESSSTVSDTSIFIREERNAFSGDSIHEWNSPDPVARMTLRVDDFNHGDLRVTIFDAVGRVVLSQLYKTVDWYWYIDGEYYDLEFTSGGQPGLWTILLEYREFTGDVELTLEALSDPEEPDPEVPPPTEISPLLDASYGVGGRASYTPDTAAGRRVAVDSSGSAVVVGSIVDTVGRRQLAVWRFLADGTPDPSFGVSGLFTFTDSLASGGFDVAVDSAGQIVVSGWTSDDEVVTDLLLLRLTTGGILDVSFGPGGFVTIDDGRNEIAAAVAIDTLDRLLVAGTSIDLDTDMGNVILARYSSSGVLDTLSFGAAGIVRTTDATDRGWDLAVDGLGRPLVVGVRGDDMALWKFLGDGSPDLSFGTMGVVTSSGGADEVRFGRSLALRSDGSIAVTGVRLFTSGTAPVEMAIWRFAADGSPLLSFGGSGFLAYRFATGWAFGGDVSFDTSNRILVAGATRSTGTPITDGSATLWRFFDSGALDTTLLGSGNTGVVRYDARSNDVGTGASALAVTPGGVLVTGGAFDRSTRAVDLIVWKLQP